MIVRQDSLLLVEGFDHNSYEKVQEQDTVAEYHEEGQRDESVG